MLKPHGAGIAGRVVVAVAVISSIAAPVCACWVGGSDFLLLVGQEVLRPSTVSLILWSFGVLVSACLLATIVVRHRLHSVERRARHVFVGGILAVTLVGTGTWCVGQAVVIEGWNALGKHAYTVLRAPDIGGCALIAHEVGALRITRGQVYAVDRFGYARPAGSWVANEIEFWVHDGAYSLNWNGEAGTLSLGGTQAKRPDRLQLTCPE